jgi:hypothetical protein
LPVYWLVLKQIAESEFSSISAQASNAKLEQLFPLAD